MIRGLIFCAIVILQLLPQSTIFQQTDLMKQIKQPPEIAEIVRHWMPNASEEELKEATVNFRAYLAVLYRIFLRLEAEGRLDEICDFPDEDDRVKERK